MMIEYEKAIDMLRNVVNDYQQKFDSKVGLNEMFVNGYNTGLNKAFLEFANKIKNFSNNAIDEMAKHYKKEQK